MYSKFNIERHHIASRLFIPEPPKNGQVWTNLNISVLPDYLQYIKNQLSKQQQILLSEYHLQTFLIEIAMKPHPRSNFDDCTNKIIQHIRKHQQFWMQKSKQDDGKLKVAQEEYEKDTNGISEATASLKQKYPQKPYILTHKKLIPEDYSLIQEQNQISLIKFPLNTTLLPFLIDYIIQQNKNSQSSQQMIQSTNKKLFEDKRMKRKIYEELIQQLLLGIKSKSKTTYQFVYSQRNQSISEEQKKSRQEGQKIINEFSQFIQKFEHIQSKSLSSAREYVLIANLIQILRKIENLNTQQNQQSAIQIENQEKAQKIEQIKQQNIDLPLQEENIAPNIQMGQQQNIENKLNEQMSLQNSIKMLKSDLCNKIYTKFEIQQITKDILKQGLGSLMYRNEEKRKKQIKSMDQWYGFFDDEDHIAKIQQEFQEMFDHPHITTQAKYRVHGIQIPWRQQQYRNFLEKFVQFYNVPTNNRKIALGMSQMITDQQKQVNAQIPQNEQQQSQKAPESIEPSHVKYIKGIYCRNMGQRIDAGEIGGGKKGNFDSKIQFIKRDIENFNMRWFKKDGIRDKGRKDKNKRSSKRSKRRHRYDMEQGEEYDSDY